MRIITISLLVTASLLVACNSYTGNVITTPSVTPTVTVSPSAMIPPQPTITITADHPTCEPTHILKIMPLGDSITYGETALAYGGYENMLGRLLTNDGYQFDFVGSQKSPSKIIPDTDHEGHQGWSIMAIKEGIDSQGWLETYQPDIILLHIGTNDIRGGNGIYAPDYLSALLDDILSRLPETHIIVAQIIPFRWGATAGNHAYNDAIPGIVKSKGRRVSMVDMQTLLSYNDYTGSIHPNKSGYDKIAGAWEKAILDLKPRDGCDK